MNMVPREGKPAAITINPEADDQHPDQPDAAWYRFWATVAQIRERNAGKDPDEVPRAVTAVVEEVRQEQYERARRKARERC